MTPPLTVFILYFQELFVIHTFLKIRGPLRPVGFQNSYIEIWAFLFFNPFPPLGIFPTFLRPRLVRTPNCKCFYVNKQKFLGIVNTWIFVFIKAICAQIML